MNSDHRTLAQNLSDHLSSPSGYMKLDAETQEQQRHVPALTHLLLTAPNALKVARMTKENLLSPMSNLRLAIARLSRKRKNFAMAQEMLIQVFA